MIKVAFASHDRAHVNLHFGAAETFVVYEVSRDRAELLGVASFDRREMKGQYKDYAVPEGVVGVGEPGYIGEPVIPEDSKSREDKVTEKLEFLQDYAAVYAVAVGASSVKRLMGVGVQPVIVRNGQEIEPLLQEIATALSRGGVSWVDRAVKKAKARQTDRFEAMASEPWVEDEPWSAQA